MKDATGFTAFVPGFDFIKNLAQQANGKTSSASAAMPGMAAWVAPTFDVEELDKRISELKSVQFWLEQNARALAATIQALEVQKMTLSTLKSMDVGMEDVSKAMKINPADLWAAWQTGATQPSTVNQQASEQVSEPVATDEAPSSSPDKVDPTQWWASVSQQFQDIAANAMQDISKAAAQANAMVQPVITPRTKTAPVKKAANKKPAAKQPAANKPAAKRAAAKRAAPANRRVPAVRQRSS